MVLYELLAGRRPFVGKTELVTLQKVIHETPVPLAADVPPALRLAAEKALSKNPEERYQSMREMVVDLRRVAHQSLERRRYTPAWAAAVLVPVLLVTGFFTWRAPESTEPLRGSLRQMGNLGR